MIVRHTTVCNMVDTHSSLGGSFVTARLVSCVYTKSRRGLPEFEGGVDCQSQDETHVIGRHALASTIYIVAKSELSILKSDPATTAVPRSLRSRRPRCNDIEHARSASPSSGTPGHVRTSLHKHLKLIDHSFWRNSDNILSERGR